MPSKPSGGKREGRNHDKLPPELRLHKSLQPRGVASRMIGPAEPVTPDISSMIDVPTSTLTEEDLLAGYRNAHGALGRPEMADDEDDGGEPVSRGRTPEKEIPR